VTGLSDKAFLVAKALMRSGALKFGSFKLKSGVTSPYYIDLTWLLSSPNDLECIVNIVAEEIQLIRSEEAVDKLASIELKGALLLPSIASKLRLPCVVVRKESKKYGVTDRIAGGEITKGDRIVFFDDVVTSGGSKIEGIQPIERAGGKIVAVLVVVDREQGGKQALEKQGYKVKSVTTISEIAKNLVSAGVLPLSQANKILESLST
jgi:orotate phosphoribosyltransferase